MSIGPWQIILVALVILVLFGASRLGDIGKGLGEGIKNFKKGIADEDSKPPEQIPEGSETDSEVVDEKVADKKNRKT